MIISIVAWTDKEILSFTDLQIAYLSTGEQIYHDTMYAKVRST